MDFYNNNEKGKLISELKLDQFCTILELCVARIYIAYEDSDNFEYTNLEGYLCLTINRKYSNLYFYLYNYSNLKKEFEIELYTNVEKGYSILKDNFHSIEYPTFFLGVNFFSSIQGEKMKNSIFYHSYIISNQVTLFSLKNSKKDESERHQKIFNELNNILNKEEKSFTKILEFSISKENSNANIEINKEEFLKIYEPTGLSYANIESHYKKKYRGIVNNKQDDHLTKPLGLEKKFIEYNSSKRLSLSFENNHELLNKSLPTSAVHSQNNASIKHFVHVMVG
jgi:hypothetical protein